MQRICLLAVVLAALPVEAQELTTIQGRLSNAAGVSVDGLFDLTLRLFDQMSEGNELWSEGHTDVDAQNGIFSLDAGLAGELPAIIAAHDVLWLEIKVGLDPPLPRRPLRSAARSMVSTLAKNINCSGCITPEHTSFMGGCTDGDGLVYNGEKWTCGTVAGTAVPTGMIAFFATSACPPGWSAYEPLIGRVIVGIGSGGTAAAAVGQALDDKGTRTIDQVAVHSHKVDAPSATTSTNGGSHSHSIAHNHSINPPSTSTNNTGAHTHNLDTKKDGLVKNRVSGNGFPAFTTEGGNTSQLASTTSNGGHSHSVDIGAFTSGGSSTANSGSASSQHNHSINLPAFDSAATGSTSVDVTMPYLQLLPCIAP